MSMAFDGSTEGGGDRARIFQFALLPGGIFDGPKPLFRARGNADFHRSARAAQHVDFRVFIHFVGTYYVDIVCDTTYIGDTNYGGKPVNNQAHFDKLGTPMMERPGHTATCSRFDDLHPSQYDCQAKAAADLAWFQMGCAQELVIRVLGVTRDRFDLSPDAILVDDLGADSLDMVELQADLEEHGFGAPDEAFTYHMRLKDLAALIKPETVS